MRLRKMLRELVEDARVFGLPEKDINDALEYLEYNEFGLCFDTITCQMYEYSIEIDEAFFVRLHAAANKMELSEQGYSYMKELIK